jgi:fumarate hydratase subunit beta
VIKWKTISAPLNDSEISGLQSGDAVLINGVIFTARDKAHQRFAQIHASGEPLPIDLSGQIIYYAGPSPAAPGKVIGSAGPTTSGRMDPFTDLMLQLGIKGMIGKGGRSREVKELFPYYSALYMSSIGGAGAYISTKIISSEIVAFEDLGPEAVYRLEVAGFPAIVINDIHGGDLYDNVRNRV